MVAVTQTFSHNVALDLNIWLSRCAENYTPIEVNRIRAVLAYVQRLYVERRHPDTQFPLFTHAVHAANLLLDLKLDSEAVMACLLFATPDLVSLESIREQFGQGVTRLVEGVQRVKRINSLQQTENTLLTMDERAAQIEAMRKMILAMVEDMRVVLVKLAWRTQTMLSLADCSTELAQKIARETLDIFAPLANRLGIWQMKWALEDLAFRYLHPEEYKNIATLLDEKRDERQAYIDQVQHTLRVALEKAHIKAEVSGRVKHIYSIWRKMTKKKLTFSQLYDVRAVRVLVPELIDCYSTLGIVHQLWKPIPGEFDDYISQPKGNNYQSLHTVIIGPADKGVEVQIRTFDMHKHAEFGVAAHWRYKEGGQGDGAYESKIAWLRQLIEWRDGLPETSDAISEKFHTELFNDTVYVLTPHGKVVSLPAGCTPVDFAYHVHTDLGHHCRGAKVNGQIVPLNYCLRNGERVEILSTKQGGPSIDWLRQGYLKSHRAQSKVRAWLRAQNNESTVELGKDSVEKALIRLGKPSIAIEQIAQNIGLNKVEALYLSVGRGEVSQRQLDAAIQTSVPVVAFNPALIVRDSRVQQQSKGIVVNGVGDLMSSLAKCCKPVYGDLVVGFVTRGRGVSVHRRDCRTLRTLAENTPERIIPADWGQMQATDLFAVDIIIIAQDRSGLLRDISDVFARDKLNVTAIQTQSRQHYAEMHFTLEVRHPDELRRALSVLSQINGVETAERVR